MTSALEVWADKVLKVIDAETTRRTSAVVLQVDGATWERWTAPFPDAATWASEAELLLSQIKEESPPRKMSAIFTAEDESGAVRSTLPRTLVGQNKSAADTQTGPKALADSFQAQANTMKSILDSARVQAEAASAVIKSQSETIMAQNDLIQAKAEEKILEKENAASEQVTPAIQAFLAQNAGQVVPRVLALIDLYLETKGGKGGASALSKAIQEATQENGVPS